MHISPLPALVHRRGFSGRRHGRPALGCGLLACLALAWGCSKQGEGERCDLNNGDLDCDTGLVCRGEDQLSIVGRGVALCCPSLAEPTVDACRANTALPEEQPEMPEQPQAPEPDAGGGAAPTPDAAPLSPAPVLDAGDGGS